jgi:serine protease Do
MMNEQETDKHPTIDTVPAPLVPATPSLPPHTPKRHRSVKKIQLLAGALAVMVCASAGFGGGWLASRAQGDTATQAQKQEVVLKSQGELISQLATNVGPSVVSVLTTAQSTSGGPFGQAAAEQGAGTGIVLTQDGLIVTNRHVVPAGTTSVSVTLSDGTQYDNVTVIGRTGTKDSLDIAFLKIQDTKGKKLTPAKIGDSSKIQVGDPVVAIGNALGQFQNTVTSGIISGYGRSIQASDSTGSSTESLENLFQTDAAINQGNSGGPLINLDGKVIGINTAIAASGNSIGFAIPINDVQGLINSVMKTGKLERPYIGVLYVPITADVAKQYNLPATSGAYVLPSSVAQQDSIINGSPADKAGIQEGDIITKVNSNTIDASHSLTALLGQHSVGDKVTLTILRGGKQQTIDVTLGIAPTS